MYLRHKHKTWNCENTRKKQGINYCDDWTKDFFNINLETQAANLKLVKSDNIKLKTQTERETINLFVKSKRTNYLMGKCICNSLI
jgi:hypothetical protein